MTFTYFQPVIYSFIWKHIRWNKFPAACSKFRAVPSGIWLVGGRGLNLKKEGPPPIPGPPLATGGGGGGRSTVCFKNKTSTNCFQTLVLRKGDLNLVFQTFFDFDLDFPENSLIFTRSSTPAFQGPLSASWVPSSSGPEEISARWLLVQN
jgi:hypothetical protein